MSIDIDQDSKCLEGNSGGRSSGSLRRSLVVYSADEKIIVRALQPRLGIESASDLLRIVP
jgi:hypothetical protein